MRQSLVAVAAFVLGLSACGSGAQEAGRTDSVTQGLLSETPGSARVSGDATEVPSLPADQDAPTIDVALLGFDRGSKGAPVRVVEMSDYGCGYCKRFHDDTWPVLLREFVDAGKVEWKFMPFITGMFQNSLAATEAAECALEQSADLFERFSDRLWAGQSEWKGAANPEPLLRSWAVELDGLDAGTFDSCVRSDRRTERIAAATALARELGVRGTPTFFVVGYPPLQGALPTEAFQEILDAVHARATQAGG